MGVLIDSSVLIDLERYRYRGQAWPYGEQLKQRAGVLAHVSPAEVSGSQRPRSSKASD